MIIIITGRLIYIAQLLYKYTVADDPHAYLEFEKNHHHIILPCSCPFRMKRHFQWVSSIILSNRKGKKSNGGGWDVVIMCPISQAWTLIDVDDFLMFNWRQFSILIFNSWHCLKFQTSSHWGENASFLRPFLEPWGRRIKTKSCQEMRLKWLERSMTFTTINSIWGIVTMTSF